MATTTRPRATLPTKTLVLDGVLAGLFAGLIFAIMEMIVAGSVVMPWRAFASVVSGQDVMQRPFSFGIFILGFVVHFGLSAIFGAIWGLLSKSFPETVHRYVPALAALGMAFGLALWAVNFQLFGNLIFEWFTEMNQAEQILLHVLAFGLPLGIAQSLFERTQHRRRGAPRRIEAV